MNMQIELIYKEKFWDKRWHEKVTQKREERQGDKDQNTTEPSLRTNFNRGIVW